MQTGVLHMIRSHFLLPFDLHVDLEANGARHGRLVRPLLCNYKHTHTHSFRTAPQIRDSGSVYHSTNYRLSAGSSPAGGSGLVMAAPLEAERSPPQPCH